MRNNGYNASLYRMMKGKKIARAPPTIQKRIIQKPIMPTIVIVPLFVL